MFDSQEVLLDHRYHGHPAMLILVLAVSTTLSRQWFDSHNSETNSVEPQWYRFYSQTWRHLYFRYTTEGFGETENLANLLN